MRQPIMAEIGLLVRRPGVGWLLALLVALLLATGLGAARDNARTRADFARTSAAERARWLGQSAKNPHRAAHFGLWAFRPPAPLSAIDPGTDPFVGRMIRIEAHHPGVPLFQSALDAAPLRPAGARTMSDLIALLVPLAAAILGHASIAADRESGTLRLVAGNGTRIGTLAAVRFAAAFVLLSVAVCVPLLIVGAVVGGASTGGALAGILVATLAYTALFLAIATAVSLRASTSRGALAVLLGIWIVFCVVAPRLVTATIEAARPTPSAAVMLDRVAAINRVYNSPAAAAARKRRLSAILEREGGPGRINGDGVTLLVRDHHDNAVYDAQLTDFSRQMRAQDRLLTLAGAVTPTLAFQQVVDALADSGSEAHLAFLHAAERYRRRMSDFMNRDLGRHPSSPARPYLAGPSTFRALPPFGVPAQGQAVRSAMPAAILLAGWLFAGLAVLGVAARRARP